MLNLLSTVVPWLCFVGLLGLLGWLLPAVFWATITAPDGLGGDR